MCFVSFSSFFCIGTFTLLSSVHATSIIFFYSHWYSFDNYYYILILLLLRRHSCICCRSHPISDALTLFLVFFFCHFFIFRNCFAHTLLHSLITLNKSFSLICEFRVCISASFFSFFHLLPPAHTQSLSLLHFVFLSVC